MAYVLPMDGEFATINNRKKIKSKFNLKHYD